MLAALFLASAPLSRAQTPPSADAAIAGNPGAVNISTGSGELGRLLGLTPDSGITLGGVVVSNGSTLLSGGNNPGKTSFNNLLVVGLQADLDKLAHIPGATFGVALLRFDGEPSNQEAGTVTGYNGLPGAPPLDRTELYELWWRQSLFNDKLIVRIGKTVPTYDFGNVARPVPVQDRSLAIPATTGLIYTPIFVNPTILGALPGYYNSAYGVTTTIAPNPRLYVTVGIYDGNLAHNTQTGLLAAPTLNENRFQIAEAGTAWVIKSANLPGSFAVGAWDQTGTLMASSSTGTVSQNGALGAYAFGSQRVWSGSANGGRSGVSGLFQVGANNSKTMLATRYLGFGMTAFGVLDGRPRDSFGAGVAWSTLNENRNLRPHEALLQAYAQVNVIADIFVQPVLSLSPDPGEKTARGPAIAFSLQTTVLF